MNWYTKSRHDANTYLKECNPLTGDHSSHGNDWVWGMCWFRELLK